MLEREAPRRLRAQDVIDAQAETIRNLTERHTSGSPAVAVDFTRNAKGETQIGVKVTANAEADPAALKAHANAVFAVSLEIYERAAMRFPTSSGTVTNDEPPRKSGKGDA